MIDLVTDADISAEKKISSIISKSFPRDEILGEESGKKNLVAERVWVVDPLDGTTNFAHKIPWFAVSIGLFEGEEKLGVIFDPLRKDLYTVENGEGAFLNGKRIFVSKNSLLIDCVFATGFPYERGKIAQKTVRSIGNLVGVCQGVRRFGSAVLDLALVARGAFDGFFEYKLFPWDAGAGILLAREAGGKVTQIDGSTANAFSTNFLATNGLLHKKLMESLEKP
ncbi:MAG: inositol monophosphatase [Candidatus Diapherotrites archaeon]|nr:inositol monophosphatase [Candidatus Diapherotrites archaeon]